MSELSGYWDIASGEELSDSDLEERYIDMLDEVVGDVSIGSLTYSASAVLSAVDPIAFRCGFADWLDAEIGETITEDVPTVTDED